jgi:hypothetical protein
MNITINNNRNIDYDEDIITKIKEMIEKGLRKLKSFVKSNKKSDLKFYYDIDERFNRIANTLEQFDFLSNEFDYFLSISNNILYIIFKNCTDPTFGHYDYALELFDFFKEIWDAKLKLIDNYDETSLKEYEESQEDFRDRSWKYQQEFYLNIHESSGEFTGKEIYSIHEKLRE